MDARPAHARSGKIQRGAQAPAGRDEPGALRQSRRLPAPPPAARDRLEHDALARPRRRMLRAGELAHAAAAPRAAGFVHVPEARANAAAIVDACRTDWDFKETIFPAFRALSDAEAFALLQEKTYAGARRRYAGPPDEGRER